MMAAPWGAGCIEWMKAILGKIGRQVLALFASVSLFLAI